MHSNSKPLLPEGGHRSRPPAYLLQAINGSRGILRRRHATDYWTRGSLMQNDAPRGFCACRSARRRRPSACLRTALSGAVSHRGKRRLLQNSGDRRRISIRYSGDDGVAVGCLMFCSGSPQSFPFDRRDQFSASAIQKTRFAGSRSASCLHSAARAASSS
jgi:hypothetical protein